MAIDQILWPGALLVFAVVGAPWAFMLFRGLPSRGVLLAAPLGMFLAHYLAWAALSTGLAANGRGLAAAALLLFALASAGLAWLGRRHAAELWARRRLWAAGVGLLLAVYALGVAMRWLNPEIIGTEKPMDFALLNAAARAPAFPPPDPWFAGESVNYYYLGYSLAAFGTHLSGAHPAVGFNLSLASLLGLSALAAASAGYDLAILTGAGRRGRTLAAGAALALTVLAGNLAVVREYAAEQTSSGFWSGIGWRASRTIQREDAGGLLDYTINEFPAFSFILGDLHPHVMALPYTLLAVSLAVQWMLRAARPAPEARLPRYARAGLTGMVLASLYALNAWDVPTFTGLVLLGTALVAFSHRGPRRALAVDAGVALAVGAVAWLPYLTTYIPVGRGVGLVTVRSQALDHLQVFGLLLAAALAALAALLWDSRPRGRGYVLLACAAAPALVLASRGEIAAALAALLALSLVTLWRRRRDPGAAVLCWLIAAGLALLTLVEVFYVDDFFEGAYARMNTVFKLHYQAWTLLAVAAGPGLVLAWRRLAAPAGAPAALGRAGILGGFALLAVLAADYPVRAMLARAADSPLSGTLDGLAAIQRQRPDEAAAAAWLRARAPRGAVLLEAPGRAYSGDSRISTWTGIPSVIGWTQHQELWRGPDPRIEARARDVDTVYTSDDPALRRGILDRYAVTHVVVGDVEIERYGQSTTERLRGELPLVFASGRTVVFEVPRAP